MRAALEPDDAGAVPAPGSGVNRYGKAGSSGTTAWSTASCSFSDVAPSGTDDGLHALVAPSELFSLSASVVPLATHRPPATVANPHKTADAPPSLRVGFRKDDIDAALGDLNETLDVNRGDIDTLLRQVELRALLRTHGEVTCGDIMSRDVISVGAGATPEQARSLLLEHDIRTLPVIGKDGSLLGTVGLRELAALGAGDVLPISQAAVARAADPAIGLLPILTDGLTHAVVIVDEDGALEGIVSQTDLLATLAKSLLANSLVSDMMAAGQGI